MKLPCAQEPQPLQQNRMPSLRNGAYGHDEAQAGPSVVMREDDEDGSDDRAKKKLKFTPATLKSKC